MNKELNNKVFTLRQLLELKIELLSAAKLNLKSMLEDTMSKDELMEHPNNIEAIEHKLELIDLILKNMGE